MATTLVQEPYNLFAQQKMAGYPSGQVQQPQQNIVPGQVVGETPQQFAQGKFNNGQPVVQTPHPAPVTTPQANKPAGTVDNLSGTGFASQGNGQQQPITSMDDLAEAMNYTTPEQEDKLRKASVANQRMLAVVDALRHIGNIAHTVNYAPSQQFNKPWEEENQRYLQGKALRDRANQAYISYQQQKAKQDAEQRRWEQQFKYNAAKDAANFELKKNESEARQQRQNALAELDKARLEGQIDKNTYQRLVNQYYPGTAEARIKEIESRIAKNGRTGGGRSGGSGSTAKYWVYDEDGNKHYYHNKTMYEQGVEQYGSNLPQTETYKSTDQYGDVRTVERRTPSTKKGGMLARNATNKGRNSKANPYGDNTKKGNTQKNHKSNPYG